MACPLFSAPDKAHGQPVVCERVGIVLLTDQVDPDNQSMARVDDVKTVKQHTKHLQQSVGGGLRSKQLSNTEYLEVEVV